MIKTILLFSTIFSMLFGDELVWQKDLQHAFETAQKESRMIMVMVEGEHCRWCKKMRYRTLGDERVAKALKPYINVRVDEADTMAMQELPPIEGVPTIFFLYPDKKVAETVIGYYSVNDFLSFIKEVNQKVWQITPVKE